jgi:ribonuclease J
MRIYTVGGFSEVGKNMTVIETEEDAIIIDAGLYLPPIVELEEREGIMNEGKLRSLGAIPDDLVLDKLGISKKVRAILIGHAHLDHVGAVPYIAHRYKAGVVGTPFTIEVLKSIISDEHVKFTNPIKSIQPNSSYTVKGKGQDFKVEFINITHSTPQTSLIAVHTKEGVVFYANDFKLDNSPQLGQKPNYEAIRKIAKEDVKALVVESLYASEERKTPSEKVAKGLLEDVMLTVDNKNAGMIVTTFSSHIARLKSIVEFGRKLNRKVVFLGRSLNKYTHAAINAKVCPFQDTISLVSYKRKVHSVLKRINAERSKYLIVCTGHQGEPGSILDRVSRGETPFKLSHNDNVIFSSSVIPSEINIQNRTELDDRLKKKGVRIFNNVHVSGHAGREDLRDFINLISPKHIIPAHGDASKLSALAELAHEMGYKIGKNCHVSQDLKGIDIR